MFGKIIFSTLISFNLLSYAELDSLEQLQKQAASMLSGAGGASRDLEAAEYLLGKFKLGPDGKPTWYPQFYPLPTEMGPTSEVKPRIHLFKPVSQGQTLPAPILEVFRKKNGTNGNCESNFITLSPTYKSFGSIAGTDYCMEEAKEFAVDISTLASLEKLSTVSADEAAVQSAFISVLNMEALSDSQKNQLMTDPNSSIRTILDSLSSDSDKQALFDPRPIRFKKYIPDPGHPFKLGAVQAQVGSMIVHIPVSAPPSPQCTIQVLTPQPVDLGQEVQFNVLSNSVVRGGAVRLDNEKQSVFDLDNLVNNPTSQMGSFVKVNRAPLTMTFTEEDRQDSRIPKLAVPGSPSQQRWVMKGSVYGVNSSESSECTPTEIRINHPLPPICALTVEKTQLLKDESTTATLDCSAGGPLSSVEISTFRDPIMQQDGSSGSQTGLVSGRDAGTRTQIGPKRFLDLSTNTTKIFTFQHTKTEVVAGETIVARVTGPRESKEFSVDLGAVCLFNETNQLGTVIRANDFGNISRNLSKDQFEIIFWGNHIKQFFNNAKALTDERYDRVHEDSSGKYIELTTIDAAGIPKTEKRYLSGLDIWDQVQPKIDIRASQTIGVYSVGDRKLRTSLAWSNGNQLIFSTLDVTETPNAHPLGPLKLWETFGDVASLSSTEKDFYIRYGGQHWHMAVGPRSDPQCTVQSLYLRVNGCFTPDTRIQMANGSIKLVSAIKENDYIFNAHYGVGIRVKKVVKGPEKKSLYEVKTSEGKVEVTKDHPFLTGRGWVQTIELKPGDQLLGNGKPKIVSHVKKLKYQGPQDVWNFELDTEDPMAHVVIANGIPTGDLVTQLELKKPKAKLP